MMPPYAFLDTETTGLLYNGNSSPLIDHFLQPAIVEFCCILYDADFNEIRRVHFLCAPPEKCSIDKKAWQANGIDPNAIANLPKFECRIPEVDNILSEASAIVGHNLAFDLGMLRVDYDRTGRRFDLKGQLLICTVEQTLPIRGYRLSLGAWHEVLFGSAHVSAHRAAADVQALAACVKNSGLFTRQVM